MAKPHLTPAQRRARDAGDTAIPKQKRRSPGSGSIYFEKASQLWRGKAMVNGKLERVSAVSKDLCEARLEEVKAGGDPRAITSVPKRTLAATLREWLQTGIGARGKKIKDNTWLGHEQHVRIHIIPHFGEKKAIEDLTFVDVADFFDKLRDVDGYQNGTCAGIRSTLSAGLRYAKRKGLVRDNVAQGHSIGEAGSGFNVVGFSEDLAADILDAVRGHRFADFYSLLTYIPMREGELLGCDWSRVVLNTRTISVVAQATRVRAKDGPFMSARAMGTPKTIQSRRDVPIPSEAERILRRMYREAGYPKSGLLFPAVRDRTKPLHPTWLLKEFKKVMAANGINVTTLHQLRHIGISLLLANGVPLEAVVQIAGHADSAITLRLYAHVLSGRAHEAAETMTFFTPEQKRRRDARKARLAAKDHPGGPSAKDHLPDSRSEVA